MKRFVMVALVCAVMTACGGGGSGESAAELEQTSGQETESANATGYDGAALNAIPSAIALRRASNRRSDGRRAPCGETVDRRRSGLIGEEGRSVSPGHTDIKLAQTLVERERVSAGQRQLVLRRQVEGLSGKRPWGDPDERRAVQADAADIQLLDLAVQVGVAQIEAQAVEQQRRCVDFRTVAARLARVDDRRADGRAFAVDPCTPLRCQRAHAAAEFSRVRRYDTVGVVAQLSAGQGARGPVSGRFRSRGNRGGDSLRLLPSWPFRRTVPGPLRRAAERNLAAHEGRSDLKRFAGVEEVTGAAAPIA